MERRRRSRTAPDLLVRPPVLTDAPPPDAEVIDVNEQLEELARLLQSGLISADEHERQVRKVRDA
jgi:hypothetical protein